MSCVTGKTRTSAPRGTRRDEHLTYLYRDADAAAMTVAVRVECITMAGNEYVLWERSGLLFPHGELRDGESPAEAARRLVQEWTGTLAPKLELVDMLSASGVLTLVFRAILTDEPKGAPTRVKRMELPETVGSLSGKYVEDALKTSLNYKLIRG